MNKCWSKVLLIVVGLIAIAVGIAIMLRPEEPVYGGQTLSFWLGRLLSPVNAPGHQQALGAIRSMGPAIVPVLLRRYNPRPQFYEGWYDRAWQKLPAEVQRHLAVPCWLRRGILAHALRQLGPDYLPSLCQACGNPEFTEHRPLIEGAIWEISRQADPSPVPALLILTQAPLGEVRAEVAMAFGQMATNLSTHIPAVVAALTPLLADSHPYAREEAAYALWRINRDTNALSLLVTELKQTKDIQMSTAILNHFYEIKRIEGLSPVISNVINRSAQLRKVFAPNPFE